MQAGRNHEGAASMSILGVAGRTGIPNHLTIALPLKSPDGAEVLSEKLPSLMPNLAKAADATSTSRTYYDLVEQSEALALAGPDEPLQISALCRALAISERTLRKAFHKIHGVPPCRHLRMLRLWRARRALLSADARSATVTEIATSFGFVELGRFSVEYREAFGESPSQTLQHGGSDRILAIGGSGRHAAIA
jgi:AraC-like DNA-binding protein